MESQEREKELLKNKYDKVIQENFQLKDCAENANEIKRKQLLQNNLGCSNIDFDRLVRYFNN